ncbi:MAG: TylF/MycF family methyltransferase [gamma proteobacterium symbiont of Taylorina sp.]|nr:TylF/MycF family methyltransferase [gamma proteobacterium symbiont of Taylorina sp.]
MIYNLYRKFLKKLPKRRLHQAVYQKYIELIKATVLNSVYYPGEHVKDGRHWSSKLPEKSQRPMSMVGMKRLDNIQMSVETVITENIKGDLIETGVWRGGSVLLMKAILVANNEIERKVFLADSFQGIPAVDLDTYPDDAIHVGSDKMPVLEDNSASDVREFFEKMELLDDNVIFLEGWFEDTLPTIATNSIAVLRLDGDIYKSTWEALINLYDKVSSGGFIIIDDYYSWEGCRKAVDDFRSKNGIDEKIIDVDWTCVYWRKS